MTVKYDQARHQHWRRVLDTALTTQHVTTLQTEEREELAYNLADATAASPPGPTSAQHCTTSSPTAASARTTAPKQCRPWPTF